MSAAFSQSRRDWHRSRKVAGAPRAGKMQSNVQLHSPSGEALLPSSCVADRVAWCGVLLCPRTMTTSVRPAVLNRAAAYIDVVIE